ncbi:MAG TPA: ABC transporter permease [Gemmatimonadaceae bacterium]|nr:ABC transporter permease [Gemmatimonadaceae bacterium]
MEWIRRLARRARLLARRGRAERAMDDEMRYHLECEAAERVRQGMSPDDARRSALADFGGVERFKEEGRDARGVRPLEDLARDLHFALRVLRRNPGFTAATVLTLALGIGAATAIYSVVYGVLLRPLPYADAGRLVVLWERDVAHGAERNVVSVANFEAWRERSRSFEGMAGLVPKPAVIAGTARAERVMGAEVSPGYFQLLGVAPALGREFGESDAQGGGAAVIVLSDGYWKRHFGGDPAALGRALTIDGRPHTVVGVMPPDFDPPRFAWLDEQQMWFPFAATERNRSWGRFLLVVARLKDGVTLDRARAEMRALAEERAREDAADRGWSATVVALAEQLTGDVRTSLLVLLGAVALLLTIAVANVATLSLTLMRRRGHELAVRRAIGASTRRIAAQLFTQSALLGAAGAAAGLVAAAWGVRLLLLVLPAEVPRAASIRVDGPVLAATTAAAVLATLVFGTVTALGSATRDGAGGGGGGGASLALRERAAGRGASSRLGGSGGLVAAEVALGLVLSVLAGLMARSFVALRAVELGFSAERVVAARVSATGERYATPEQQRAFYAALLERIRALPGVRAAGVASTRPFGGMGPATAVGNSARPTPPAEAPVADVRYVDAGFFDALRIPLLAGSVFDARERPGGPPRVVISQSTARALWPNESPVGRRLAVVGMFGGIAPEVIGVVGDVHLADARTPPRPAAFLADARFPDGTRDLVVRVDGGAAESIVPSLRSAVAGIDPGVPLHQVTTMDALADASLARDRFTTLLLGAFAAAALLLAAVGIYGVFAGDVARRRTEIGIRLALGARRSGVVLLVLRRALTLAAVGVAIGAAAALLAARSVASLLFGVGAADPASFAAVGVLLLAVAAAASLVPALAAARVSPLEVMRDG